jgi:type VI secretion system protein ImpB
MASVHQKLGRVRKPRVHITYEVETDGAMILRELPFVVGVLSDLSGDGRSKLKPLRDRNFIGVDPDNFNEVMARMAPSLNLEVNNTLTNDGTDLKVELKFNSMDDFDPVRVVEQVDPLRKLLETRNNLRDLLAKADRSQDLESLLERILQNQDDLTNVSKSLGVGDGAGKEKN